MREAVNLWERMRNLWEQIWKKPEDPNPGAEVIVQPVGGSEVLVRRTVKATWTKPPKYGHEVCPDQEIGRAHV